ncbi:MAG: hypothetical protein LBF22_02580 [Deltaproteobacteria bacterium]|jgi:hypothetical protein|nr:hypothetical protein [Deltaproteobacteria bacterium]
MPRAQSGTADLYQDFLPKSSLSEGLLFWTYPAKDSVFFLVLGSFFWVVIRLRNLGAAKLLQAMRPERKLWRTQLVLDNATEELFLQVTFLENLFDTHLCRSSKQNNTPK